MPRENSTTKYGYGLLSLLMAGLLFIMMLGGLADILFRYFINRPIPGMSELLSLGLGVLVYGALPLVTEKNEHIKVDLIRWKESSFLGTAVHFLVNAFSSAMLLFMSWSLAQTAINFASYSGRSPFLKIDLSMIAWFMSIMSLLCALIFIARSLSILFIKRIRGATS